MKAQDKETLEKLLRSAMDRFKESFLSGGGAYLELSVSLREVKNFKINPLQVKDYLFAVDYQAGTSPFVEMSTNPDFPVDVESYRDLVRLRYAKDKVTKIMSRFLRDTDRLLLEERDVGDLLKFFKFDPEKDLIYEVKEKKERSKRSGGYEDYIVKLRYHLPKKALNEGLSSRHDEFLLAVYLYCMKVFAAVFIEYTRAHR